MRNIIRYIVIVLISFILYCCSSSNQADLVIRGGKIATVDKEFSIQEAVAVKEGKIIYVGTNSEVDQFISNETKIIDLNSELVLPGLIDAHGHLTGYAKYLNDIDLVGTKSFDEVLERVRVKLKSIEPGVWVRGRGWDQNDWDNTKFPSHEALTDISPNNPVVLSRIDGHAILANKMAMDLAGISNETKDLIGGKILRNNEGHSTGIFIDNSEELITDHIPMYSAEELRKIIYDGAVQLTKYGLTGMHDAGIPLRRIDDYKYLIDVGQMPIRVNAMLSDTVIANINEFLINNKIDSYGTDFLRVASIKLYADGALGSRGAALIEPYSDDPQNKGLIVTDSLHMYKTAIAALRAGYQVCTHAIGDRGNRYVLNIYEQLLQDIPKIDHRFRIEHAQIVNTADIKRFNDLGVIPAMQPQHAVSDMPWVERRIGKERMAGAYAWHEFIDSGSIIPCGSDAPVEIPNPLLGIYNAVTRMDAVANPPGGWLPEQKMTVVEAIKGYTIWAAFSAFQEDILGSIEVGKYADFTILDKDIITIAPSEILETKPIYTIVGGEIKYKHNKSE